eukprot:2308488-Rhodomonas_salina.2
MGDVGTLPYLPTRFLCDARYSHSDMCYGRLLRLPLRALLGGHCLLGAYARSLRSHTPCPVAAYRSSIPPAQHTARVTSTGTVCGAPARAHAT